MFTIVITRAPGFTALYGLSMLTTGHYAKMRKHFGSHPTAGIAGESMLVDYDGTLTLDELANGIMVSHGEQETVIETWEVAHPSAIWSISRRKSDTTGPSRRAASRSHHAVAGSVFRPGV